MLVDTGRCDLSCDAERLSPRRTAAVPKRGNDWIYAGFLVLVSAAIRVAVKARNGYIEHGGGTAGAE